MASFSYGEGTFQSHDGLKLFYRYWAPIERRSVIIGVHGYAEHSGRYNHVGEKLASNGFAFYMHDLRGHGNSGGERGYVRSFSEFIDDLHLFMDRILEEVEEEKVFLFGHSMGGLIATIYAIEHPERLKGLILSGPALMSGIKVSPISFVLLKIIAAIRPKYRPKIKIDASLLTNDPEVNKAYEEDPLVFKRGTIRLLTEMLKAMDYAIANADKIRVPTIIFHGKEDKIVPLQASQVLFDKISIEDKELVLMDNTKHEVLNDLKKEEALNKIIQWLTKRL